MNSKYVTSRSAALFQRAKERIPGGVNSPVRAFKGVAGRLQEVAVQKGIRYVNDTAATAPGAAVRATGRVMPKPDSSDWK